MKKLLTIAAVLVLSACSAKENAAAGGAAMKADTSQMMSDSSHMMADSMKKSDSMMARDTSHAMKK